MNQKLLDLLRKQEWLHRDRYERAQAANEAAHDNHFVAPVYTAEQLVDFELRMLAAQIELEREECSGEDPTDRP